MTNKDLSDSQLMQQVQAGKTKYLATLYERHKSMLYNYCLRKSGDRSRSQDLVHTTFEKIMKYSSNYDTNQSFKAWVLAIARNAHIDSIRAKKGITVEFQSYHHDIEDENFQEDQHSFYKKKLGKALLKLNEKEREIIELSKLENLKIKELASYFNMTESAIKVSIHRSMKKLRKLIKENE